MAKQTIQVADKPTLDEVKALLENSGYGLEAIKNALGGDNGYIPCSNNIIRYRHYSSIGDSNLDKNSTLDTVLDIQGKGLLYSSIITTSESSFSAYYGILKITVDNVVKVWKKFFLSGNDTINKYGFIGNLEASIDYAYGKNITGDNYNFNSEYINDGSNTIYRYPLLFNKSLKIEMLGQKSGITDYCFTEYELL